MTPDPDNMTTAGLFFVYVRWNAAALLVNVIQGGAVLTGVSAPYLSAIDGVTSVLTWAQSFIGGMAWALGSENIDASVVAPQCTSFYSPRNVYLSRGTLWYAAGIGVGSGVDITADDVYRVPGSSGVAEGELTYEVQAGTNPMQAHP